MKHQLFLIVLMVMGITAPSLVSAQALPTVTLETLARHVQPGSHVPVRLIVQSVSPLNAVELELIYPADTLSLQSIDMDSSPVGVGRKVDESVPGRITIVGGALPPFSGVATLATFVFVAKKEGQGEVRLATANFYRADGEGSLARPSATVTASVSVSRDGGVFTYKKNGTDGSTDGLLSDMKIYDNPVDDGKLLNFSTGSSVGPQKYLLRMRAKEWLLWGAWEVVEPPITLSPDVWAFEIEIVAEDGARDVRREYDTTVLVWKVVSLIGTLILLVGILYVGRRLFHRYNK